MATTSAWTFIVCIIMLQYAAGHRAGGDNCSKILDSIRKILKRGGYKGDDNRRDHYFVAFSAYLGSHFVAKQNHVRLNFDKVVTNYGNAYKDGIFTCPTDGLYAFDWSSLALEGKTAETILKINGKRLGYYTLAQGRFGIHGSASNSAILQLKKGNRVSLNVISRQHGYFHRSYTTFSGWLLHKP